MFLQWLFLEENPSNRTSSHWRWHPQLRSYPRASRRHILPRRSQQLHRIQLRLSWLRLDFLRQPQRSLLGRDHPRCLLDRCSHQGRRNPSGCLHVRLRRHGCQELHRDCIHPWGCGCQRLPGCRGRHHECSLFDRGWFNLDRGVPSLFLYPCFARREPVPISVRRALDSRWGVHARGRIHRVLPIKQPNFASQGQSPLETPSFKNSS